MKKAIFSLLFLAMVLYGVNAIAASKIKIGASPTPHAEILKEAAKILKPQGVELEIIEFSDYVQPNVALDSKDLDANYFQHKPYLDDFNKNNKTKLNSLGPVHYEPFGVYSQKLDSLANLKKGAIVAVPNDPSNEGRALLLLRDKGLIELKKDVGLTATARDIVKNPLELKIEEIEAPQLVRALPDIDIAVINGNYAILGGLKVVDSLALEAPDSEAATTYANIIATRDDNKNQKEIIMLYNALLNPDIAKFMKDKFGGAVLPSVTK